MFLSKIKSEKHRFYSELNQKEITDKFNVVFNHDSLDLTASIGGRFLSESRFETYYKTYRRQHRNSVLITGNLNFYPKSTEIVIEVFPNYFFIILMLLVIPIGGLLFINAFLEPIFNYYKFFIGGSMMFLLPLFLAYYSQLVKDDLVDIFQKKFRLKKLTPFNDRLH